MSAIDTLRENPLRALVALVFLFIAFLFFYDWLVISEAERIEMMVQEARDAYFAGDVEAVLGYLSEDYSSSFAPRTMIRRQMRTRGLTDGAVAVGAVRFDEHDPNLAAARISVKAVGQDGRRQSQLFTFRFKKEGTEWRIREVLLGYGM